MNAMRRVMGTIIVIGIMLALACLTLIFISQAVFALQLAPGECITDANSSVIYCAQNITMDFNSTCIEPIHTNISSELYAIRTNTTAELSAIYTILDNQSQTTDSLKTSLTNFFSSYDCVDALDVCERRLDDVQELYTTEATARMQCDERYVTLNEQNKDCIDVSVCNARVKKAQENLYIYMAVAFIGGALLLNYFRKGGRSGGEGIETHPSERGKF